MAYETSLSRPFPREGGGGELSVVFPVLCAFQARKHPGDGVPIISLSDGGEEEGVFSASFCLPDIEPKIPFDSFPFRSLQTSAAGVAFH